MKAALAGILILIGFGAMIATNFVGKTVPVDETADEELMDEISEINALVHPSPQQRKEQQQRAAEFEAKRERLAAIRKELVEKRDKANSSRGTLWYGGLAVALVGVAVQIWDMASKKTR